MKDKVTEIFVRVDDFCIECESEIKQHTLTNGRKRTRNRKSKLSESEIISILILFHQGGFRNFKHFYLFYVCKHLTDEFPELVSYNRFIELQPRCAIAFMLFVKMHREMYRDQLH